MKKMRDLKITKIKLFESLYSIVRIDTELFQIFAALRQPFGVCKIGFKPHEN